MFCPLVVDGSFPVDSLFFSTTFSSSSCSFFNSNAVYFDVSLTKAIDITRPNNEKAIPKYSGYGSKP
jgi:hypothetical protein